MKQGSYSKKSLLCKQCYEKSCIMGKIQYVQCTYMHAPFLIFIKNIIILCHYNNDIHANFGSPASCCNLNQESSFNQGMFCTNFAVLPNIILLLAYFYAVVGPELLKFIKVLIKRPLVGLSCVHCTLRPNKRNLLPSQRNLKWIFFNIISQVISQKDGLSFRSCVTST